MVLAFIPALFGGYDLYWERWTTSLLTGRLDPPFDRYQPLETVIGNFHAPARTRFPRLRLRPPPHMPRNMAAMRCWWLGTEWEEYRRYDSAPGTSVSWHSEPFAADDVVFLDGLGKRQLYIVPSQELVILRTGPNDSGWDDSRLPNILIRALQGKDVA